MAKIKFTLTLSDTTMKRFAADGVEGGEAVKDALVDALKAHIEELPEAEDEEA